MPNPLLGSVVDPFTRSTLNTSVWNSVTSGAVTLVPALGMAQLACPTTNGAFNTLSAMGPYDATGGMLFAQVTPVLSGNGGTRTIFKIFVDGSNSVAMRLESGVFKLTMQIAGTTTTTTLPAYDPTFHAWWRLREQSGTWYAETSADGFAWVTVASSAYTWPPTAVAVVLQTGASDTEPSGLFAGFQNVNTPLGTDGMLPSWPQIRFQVAFNQGANTSGSPSFVDLSSRMRGSWSAELSGRQYELDQVQSGQMNITLWNGDGALDPLNTASPYSPNVLPLRPARHQAVWPPSRNLVPQPAANGSSRFVAASQVTNTAGTFTAGVTVLPAPTGHTTAFSWTLPASTGASATLGMGSLASGGFAGPDGSAIPVVAGATYTFTCWASIAAGGDTTLQLSPRISWYDDSGTRIDATNPASGTTIAVQGSWTLLSFTYTAIAGAVNARPGIWTTTVPSSSTTVYTTAWQFERSATATPWTPGGYLYSLWSGFVERWPQQWDYQGTYGTVSLTCVDALASLAQFTLQPSFAASLQALNPAFVYPLNEPTGSTSFADSTGRNPARVIYSPPGVGSAGSITAGNSVTGSGSVGSSGPVVTVTNPNWGNNTLNSPGVLLAAQPGANFPPTSGGFTRVIAFRTTNVPTTGNAMCLWASTGPNVNGPGGSNGWCGIYIGPSQNVYGIIQNASASSGTTTPVSTVTVCDGNWHLAIVMLSADGKSWTVFVDGVAFVGTTTGNFTPTGINADTIGAQGNPVSNSWTQWFQGDIAFAAQFNYPIGNAAFDLSAGFASGWAAETSAARAQRILNMAGYKGSLSTLDASTKMGGANLSGVDAMSALQLVGDSEAGQVYVDGAGVVWLASRQWRYLQSSAGVTFGENSGEVPYLGDVEVELDDSHIYNDVTVTNQVTPGAAEQPGAHITDVTSQAAYLPRSVQRTVNVQDATVPQSAAQFLLSQYAQPLPRVGQLTVDGASNPALWSTILPLAFGVRADVKRRPPSGPGAAPITVQQFVEHLTWNGDDQGNLHLSLQLSPAQPYLGWWVVSSLHTTVATASTAGTATVTLGALTGSANNPAAAVLSPGTQLTLGYGTANAETLTVKSVAGTSPGYTSVAVTFTTNTAKNHAVGEMVCQPQPGGLTLPVNVQTAYPASMDAAATLSATTPRVAY